MARSCNHREPWASTRLPALAIATNWLIFVWAVSVNQIVQISLGYFINPLLSVLFGMVVFHERLRRLQWVSVALAAAGVLYLTVALGALPWIALSLAASFGTYGLMKKLAPLGPVQGLALRNRHSLRSGRAVPDRRGARRPRRFSARRAAAKRLMLRAGPVTTLPLLLFAAGVRRIPLSLVGMLQYINPTMQITIGVMLYKEPFTRVQLVGFGLVWTALAMFAVEGYVTRRRPQLGVTDVA